MTISFFYETYDLKTLEVKRIFSDENGLNIEISSNVHFDYIGNGLKSNFDFDTNNIFVFHDDISIFNEENPEIITYEFENGMIHIVTKINNIYLRSSEVEVKHTLKNNLL